MENAWHFDCECSHPEHTIRFALFVDDELPPELYMDVFLYNTGFFSRLKKGLMYIFGYKSKYGHFGGWTLKEDDLPKMEKMLECYKRKLDKK
jgi:hypothetical protein